MSKLNKFFSKPSIFWRDFFLKRAPLEFGNNMQALPAEKGHNTLKPKSKVTVDKANSQKTVKMVDSADLEDLYPVTFPIDIVYTWVDSNDIEFIRNKNKYENVMSEMQKEKEEISDIARFESHDELKYSIRSIFEYAPWVNHIYIVTNGQVPKWLNSECSKVSIITHDQIIDREYLPTFNSHVIESSLHKIPGLSEHYIYFNDDVMLTRPIKPEYFFTSSGLAKVFITNSLLPDGPKNINDTPTQWASKNSRALLFDKTKFFARNMFAHTFFPQLKSVHEKMEDLWGKEYHRCRLNRFRGESDLTIVTFLHNHFALIFGNAIAARTKCMYFNIRAPMSENYYKSLLARQGSDNAPYSMCLNDHKSNLAVKLDEHENKLRAFLDSYYPNSAEHEIYLLTKNELLTLLNNGSYKEIYISLNRIIKYDIIPITKKNIYAVYYYAFACYELYKVNGKNKYLDEANTALDLVLNITPSHKSALALKTTVGRIVREKN